MANKIKKECSEKRHIVYVKMSKYYIKYLIRVYGSPVCFPQMSLENVCLERYLLNNPSMTTITPLCFSEAAFNYNESASQFSIKFEKPDENDRSSYLPIVIPDEIERMYGTTKTSSTWQLSSAGTTKLRKLMMRNFWLAFSRFHDECKYRASRIGETCGVESIISDFMGIYDIDMCEYDNLLRYWRRTRSRIQLEIERERDRIEACTGNVFFYTA